MGGFAVGLLQFDLGRLQQRVHESLPFGFWTSEQLKPHLLDFSIYWVSDPGLIRFH